MPCCRALALVTMLMIPGFAWAQAAQGPYINLGLGADFLQNESLRPAYGPLPLPRSYRFDVGPAGYVSLGYAFGSGIRLELEGDYANNNVRGVTFTTPLRASGYEQQFGGFVNAFQDFVAPFHLPVTPYLGVGAGYQALQLDDVNALAHGIPNPGGSETQGSFGYQGIAGISMPLGLPGLDLTAEYRMIGMVTPPAYQRTSVDGEPVRATVNNIFNHELLVGLRLLFGGARTPTPSSGQTSAPVSVPAPASTRTYLVFFDWNKADLTDRARDIIGEAAKASERVETTEIEVDGYTDLSGTSQYNQALSMRRADAVAAELMRDGVNRNEIDVKGFGEAHPLVPTAQGVREPQNRRVEIILK